jgi:hypothetical protein
MNTSLLNNTDSTNIYNLYIEMAFGIAQTPQSQHSITQQGLVDLTKQLKTSHPGNNFFSVTQVTRENTNKIPNITPFVLTGLKVSKTYLVKVSQLNGMYGHSYSVEVNKQREREGAEANFVAKDSKYKSIPDTDAFVELDGQLYLRYKPIAVADSFKPVLLKNNGNDDFEVVDKADYEQYINRINPGVYQGLQTGVQIRNISLASIVAININDKDYVISDADETRISAWKASGAPMPIQIPTEMQQ